MPETRTDLLVQAKAKGFQDVQQQATKLIDAAQKATTTQTKGFAKLEGAGRAYKKEVKALEGELKNLAKQQLATIKSMEGIEKGSKAYKELGKTLKNLNEEYGRLSSMKRKVQEVFGPTGRAGQPLTAQDMAKGGFVQGLAQGGLQIDLQRGPGMWRQAAGQSLGAMGRGFAGAPFGGVQGLQQGLSGIPWVGPAMAGQLGTIMGFGQQALELQRTRLGALPFLGGAVAPARIEAARKAGEKKTGFSDKVIWEKSVTEGIRAGTGPLEIPKPGGALGGAVAAGIATTFMGPIGALISKGLGVAGESLAKATISSDDERRLREGMSKKAEAATTAALQATRKEAGEKAAREESAKPFQDIKALGYELGAKNEAQAIEAVTAMTRRAGISAEEARRQNMIPAMFAAETAYGVSPEAAAGFAGGGRYGGMIGAKGRGSEMMVETLADAVKLGLTGADLTDYMETMASGFENWKQTGMPINPTSISKLSTSFANAVGTGIRGVALGKQVAKAGQRLSETGIQDEVDWLMMKAWGGFQGGSTDEYVEALKRLENMDITPEKMKELIEVISEASGRKAGQTTITLQNVLARKGISMRWGEAQLLVKQQLGGLSPEEEKELAKERAIREGAATSAPVGVKGLTDKALALMATPEGRAAQRAAELENKQAEIGEAILPALHDLQESSLHVSGALQTLVDGPLKDLSSIIERFTGALEQIAEKLDQGEPILGTVVDAVRGKV